MEQKPLVTVAMVTYNSSQFVRQAIQSVIDSNYRNLEILISDDNSSDETFSILQEFENRDTRIKLFRQEVNLGEYNNRNFCLKNAMGKYFLFVDGDDYIYPHGIEFMVKMMERFPDSALGLSRPHDLRFIYPIELTPSQTLRYHYLGKTVLNLSFARNIFKTEVVRMVGGFSNGFKAGDEYIRLKIASKYNIILLNDGLVWWRSTPGQASESIVNSNEGFLEAMDIKKEFLLSIENLLKEEEKKIAIKILKIKILKFLLKKIKQGDFKGFGKVYNYLKPKYFNEILKL